MLSRYQNAVMNAVYALCDGTDGCLVSPLDIMSIMPSGAKNTAERLDGALDALESGGYLEVISSERRGEKMYVISLRPDGAEYVRSAKKRRRDIAYKIFLAFVGAVATFIFTFIIKAVFGG